MDFSEKLSITVNELTKEYGPKKGIRGVNAYFESGKIHLLLGDNGSGKSTLLKCIMGLVHYQGTIRKRRVRIGYAPEEYIMPMHMTVIDFLYSIGRIKGYPRDELNDNVRFYLSYFNLTDYLHRTIKSLSHGMRQKVNLMQAFIHEPKVLILDEPLSGLDQEMVQKLLELIKEKAKQSLVLISSHHKHRFQMKYCEVYHFIEGSLHAE